MASALEHVAIVGAGLSGLCLALVLRHGGIPVTIYEARAIDFVEGGVIILSPNALQVLHKIGVFERIRSKSYEFQAVTYKNDHYETTDVFYHGDQKLYGYNAMRVSRQLVIEEMKLKLSERNTEVKYNTRFSHVISEFRDSVTFAFKDGTTSSASVLIGADGIHSTVRKHMYPTVIPRYLGILGAAFGVPRSSIRLPKEDFAFPVSISAKPGTLMLLPQRSDGSLVNIVQIFPGYPEQSREGWDALSTNTDEMVRLFQKDVHAWPDVIQSALENIIEDTLRVWPFYAIPKLEHWASDGKRVIITGDAAHAIPPTIGQGANQAFEDAYTLGSLLGNLDEKLDLAKALDLWQTFRQERTDRLMEMTVLMNNKRSPPDEQAKLPESAVWRGAVEDAEQMSWLYGVDLEKVVREWVGQRGEVAGG